MKIRNGFVSNSSSSSFLVISTADKYEQPDWPETLEINEDFGVTEFGWGPETIYDIGSRVIFAYLQASVSENDTWLYMLEKVIKENSNVKNIIWTEEVKNGYIDHQSSAIDGRNIQIFENEEILKNFIFGVNSLIEVCNDNDD